MQILKAVILLITIASALTLQSSSQSYLSPNLTLKDKLAKSHFGTAMLGMVQMGTETSADFDDLKEALQALKENLEDKKEAELADFESDGEAHKINQGRLSRLINSYNLQSIQFTDELEVLVNEGNQMAQNLNAQQGQLKSAEAQQQNEESIIAKLADDFEAQEIDYNEAITLLGKAQEKLKEAKSSTEAISFVQMNKESLTVLAQQVNDSLTKLKTSTSFIKPIGQFFVQLTTGTPDNNALDRAIEALGNLKTFYSNGLVQLKADFEATTEEHNKLLNTIKVQVGNLSLTVIPKTKQQIQANNEAQEIRNEQIATVQKNIKTEQANLETENESWEKRITTHETLMPQYDSEYAIVEQAETLLARM